MFDRRQIQLPGLFMLGSAPSAAVTLTNLDPEPFTFTATGRGERMEMTLRSGETVESASKDTLWSDPTAIA
jgi:hypothetical protein